jgi:rare lipoprotein A
MVRARKAIRRMVVPGLCAGLLALPAAAAAAPNGGTVAPGGAPLPSAPAPTATGGALAVTPSTVLERQVALVSGAVPTAVAGQGVWLQVRQGKGRWITVAHAAAAAGGSFTIAWRTNRAGQLELRVVGSDVASASSATATPQVALSVYAPVIATWYGPGLYGNHTACGETLTRSLVGLADRTLPCGTPVSLVYNGEALTLPVIDRGPFANGATLDLTHAAAEELGLTETSTVAMLSLTGPPMTPGNWFAPSTQSGATGASGVSSDGGATAPLG